MNSITSYGSSCSFFSFFISLSTLVLLLSYSFNTKSLKLFNLKLYTLAVDLLIAFIPVIYFSINLSGKTVTKADVVVVVGITQLMWKVFINVTYSLFYM